ncbi:hypothetical protein [uncultured Muribaculum sp.]|uniref:hypothetical protein n=1 Tax=uncultured Muribaculum sp. TaxID=1918613 RepID=UPI0025B07450|nr:hypothetical protein [uncultured Muribaculum sp.]
MCADNIFSGLIIHESCSYSNQRIFIIENINTGSLLEVNEDTAVLVSCLKNSLDIEIGIKKFCAIYEGVGESIVRAFIEDKLINSLTIKPQQSMPFIYNKLVLTSSQVEFVARKLSFLFKKRLGVCCFVSALILDVIYIIISPNLIRFSNNIDAAVILGLAVFMLLSSLIHEFGHAAATSRFGLNTGGIGFGLYINFPVFYTDVTNIWRLPKLHKCVVNMAGIYFQLLLVIPVIIIHYYTGIEFFKYIILATNFSFILNLNPFFRFDGYWFISDIAGVHNLRKKSREFFKYVIARILKYPITSKPFLLRLNGTLRFFLLIYAIIVNAFMLYYFLYIIPVFVWNFIHNIPVLIGQFVRSISNNIMPPFVLVHNLISELLFFFIIAFMLYRLGRNCFNGIFKKSAVR